MLKKNVMLILLVAVLLLNGCGTQENTEQTDSENNSESSVLSQEEIFSNRDFKTEYEENCAFKSL